jgi:propanol-preferring alcohol dehydrogenase
MVFSRNAEERKLALDLGAAWVGGIDETPPQGLSAAVDATPVWKPVVRALQHLAPGGRLVINAIRKEDSDKGLLTSLDFASHLWLEKEIKSVANVTRADVSAFLRVAVEAGIRPEYQEYALEDANTALLEIRQGRIRGAKVLRVE